MDQEARYEKKQKDVPHLVRSAWYDIRLRVLVEMRFTSKSITGSRTFAALVQKSFDEVDYENNKRLDHKELHIALLLLYDKLNSLLPVHMAVPTRDEVANLLKKYDTDQSGGLEYPEYLELAKALFGGKHGWKDSILLRAGTMMLLNLLVWPLAGSGARQGMIGLGVTGAAVIPGPVWSIAAENVVKLIHSTTMR